MFKKIGRAVKAAAPVLLSVAGTAGGPLGGTAANMIKNALGLGAEAKEHEIEAALAQASPEQLVALRNANKQFELDMRSLDVEELGMYLGDVSDARARQVALKDKMPAVLAYIILGLFASVIFLLIFKGVPEDHSQLFYGLIFALTSAVTQVLSFFLGSSKQSQQQGYDMAQAMRGQQRQHNGH